MSGLRQARLTGLSDDSAAGAGALALLRLIATYAIVFGILLTLLAFKVRRLGGRATGS